MWNAVIKKHTFDPVLILLHGIPAIPQIKKPISTTLAKSPINSTYFGFNVRRQQ